ncbi:hypothetical protein GPECTOR_16g589 [Gonium pectorale]|uniref:THO complex subunit 1 n=1 Tax=Gonium pectorale TaxID=33097 RepID=A0A150GL06_GONPE|nr:hypothetical protein GPECTOR_16g589 [Gonium pectorale]|eukprot:KXZ50415.1 hypothetical protein GPECTOR_16g589 [Gonium pectorale]
MDAAQRQSLEDALFEVNLALAREAVARGLPLMHFLHPDAAHVGIKTLPRFLQVCLELARPLLSEPLRDPEKAGGRRRLLDYEGWARLFEGLMEVGTIADCADLFRLMEGSAGGGSGGESELGWAGVFCSEDFRREQGAKLALLRMSNMLFRRLSKAYDVRLCGRLLIFISRCYELNDKSGLNVAGALNTGLALPIDEVEAGAVDSIGEHIDRRLYASFWGLQAVFQNPAQVLQPAVYGKVLSDVGLVLDAFKSIQNPVAATGPWVAARGVGGAGGGRAAGGAGGSEAMDVDGGGKGEAAEGGGSSGGGAGARYLTSSRLFGLQLRDCTFRRHFLLQCLALLQYIEQPSKADKSGLALVAGGRPEGLEALRDKDTAAGAPGKRKRGGGRSAAAAGGAGGAGGRYAVSRGVVGLPDPLAGLRVGERRTRSRNIMGEEEVVPMLPSAEELLAPIAEDLDPDNDVEAPYRRVREPVFAWKRMRTLARNNLEFYKKGDDLEESVLEMQPELRARIAARQAERAAELAAAAAEAGELPPASGGGSGGGGGLEEGEAVPSPGGRG